MKRRVVVQYGAIVLGSAVIAVIAAEAYLASRPASPFALPFYNRLYPYVMFRPYENVSWISDEPQAMSHYKTKVYVYTNSDGFRIPSPDYKLPRVKPARELRIAFLGASAVQLGSTYDVALPGALRKLLCAKHPAADIEVINAGIQSCVSRQSIAQLVFTVSDYQPDIVVLYDGVNDIGLPMTYESRPNFPYNFQTMEEAWDTYRRDRQEPLPGLLLSRSRLYEALRARFRRGAAARSPYIGPNAVDAERVLGDPEFVRNHIAAYLSNWRKLIELSTAYRYEPVCVLQPTGILEEDYSLPALMKFYNLSRETASRWVAAFRVLYSEAERQIGGLRREYPEVVFANVGDSLRPASAHFWDLAHVYDEVNPMLAERLCTEIQPLVEKELAKSRAAAR